MRPASATASGCVAHSFAYSDGRHKNSDATVATMGSVPRPSPPTIRDASEKITDACRSLSDDLKQAQDVCFAATWIDKAGA